MSIRALARDLYKAQQKVERIKKDLAVDPSLDQDLGRNDLRVAEKELEILCKMMEGEKSNAAFRQKFKGFGSVK